jgi:tRNA(fMet)-specific endonuclease VapC
MPTLGHSLLLDTSVVVKHFREPATALDKLASADGLYLPQPPLGELYHGAYRSNRQEMSLARIERFLDAVVLLAPDKETALFYGQIAAELAQDGTPIPQNDVWIAALARQTGVTLVTTDEHFDRIRNLAVVRW